MNTSAAPTRLGVCCAILLAAGFTVTARAQADEMASHGAWKPRGPELRIRTTNGTIRVYKV